MEQRRLRVLVSYHTYSKPTNRGKMAELVGHIEHDSGCPAQVFVDSGAFTAHMAGIKISASEYGDWLHEYKPLVNCYASLDVIGDYRGSMRNLRELEAMGLAPMPVWHAGEPFEVLRDYCQDYRYVAIGGIVNRNMRELGPHLVRWFRLGAETQTAFHGFGMTDWGCIATFPWYSVDSSSAGSAYRYGNVHVFLSDSGEFKTARLYDRKAWGRYGPHARALGIDPEVFIDKAKYHHAYAVAMSWSQWWKAEEYLRVRHQQQPMQGPGRPPDVAVLEPGPFLYIAEGADRNIRDAALFFRRGRWDVADYQHHPRLRAPQASEVPA